MTWVRKAQRERRERIAELLREGKLMHVVIAERVGCSPSVVDKLARQMRRAGELQRRTP